MTTTVEYTSLKQSPPRRFNFRIVAMIAVVAGVVGYPAYQLIRHTLNGGIERTAWGYDVDLKTLGYFPFDENKDGEKQIPDRFRALNGKTVALEGFIVPLDRTKGNGQYQLVYNVQKCCFGGPPQVQERVFVNFADNLKVNVPSMNEEVRCSGILHVDVRRDMETNRVVEVYEMQIDHIDAI